jgi:hypothetical protein
MKVMTDTNLAVGGPGGQYIGLNGIKVESTNRSRVSGVAKEKTLRRATVHVMTSSIDELRTQWAQLTQRVPEF